MVIYQCNKCEFSTNIKTHYNRHINTKKHKINLKNINEINNTINDTNDKNKEINYNTININNQQIEELVNIIHFNHNIDNEDHNIIDTFISKKYKLKDNNIDMTKNNEPDNRIRFKCENCDKLFTHKNSYYRHKKNYCKQKTNIENDINNQKNNNIDNHKNTIDDSIQSIDKNIIVEDNLVAVLLENKNKIIEEKNKCINRLLDLYKYNSNINTNNIIDNNTNNIIDNNTNNIIDNNTNNNIDRNTDNDRQRVNNVIQINNQYNHITNYINNNYNIKNYNYVLNFINYQEADTMETMKERFKLTKQEFIKASVKDNYRRALLEKAKNVIIEPYLKIQQKRPMHTLDSKRKKALYKDNFHTQWTLKPNTNLDHCINSFHLSALKHQDDTIKENKNIVIKNKNDPLYKQIYFVPLSIKHRDNIYREVKNHIYYQTKINRDLLELSNNQDLDIEENKILNRIQSLFLESD